MATFWDRALGNPAAPRVTPAQQPGWVAPQQPQMPPQGYPQQQGYLQQGYTPQAPQQPGSGLPPQFQGLALQPSRNSQQDQQAGYVAATQGYIRKPPEWVKNQSSERCPECNGVNFARHGDSEGSYGKLRRTKVGAVEFGHCFDCGYTMNGGNPMSDAQIGNAHSKGITNNTGMIKATRQPHGMRNFFEIKVG